MNEDGISGQREPVYSPPLSLDDISSAIYNKMAARYAARSQPHYPQQPSLADTPPNFQQANVDGDSWSGKAGVKVKHLEEDVVDVTSMSAQKILDEFMRQLQPHQEAGKGEEQHKGKEGLVAGQHSNKAADQNILWEQGRVNVYSRIIELKCISLMHVFIKWRQ